MLKPSKVNLLTLLVLCIFVCISLASCAPDITLDEVKEALPALVEDSRVLNEIYFGEGFEVDGSLSDVTQSGGYYYCDTSKYNLNSIIEIKEATEKVYSDEYCEILYGAAFDGLSTDTVIKAPRFTEGEKGLMQKADDTKYKLKNREFDYESLAIEKDGSDRVTVTVDTYVDGKKDDTLEIIVVRYGSEGSYSYKLDSPTY